MSKRPPPSKPQPAQLSPQQIRAAIPRLERRIRDLKDFNVGALTDADYAGKVTDLEAKLDATLVEIFGNDTADYERHRVHMIDGTSVIMFRPPDLPRR
jgi:hypothetical protein